MTSSWTAIGSDASVAQCVSNKISTWIRKLKLLLSFVPHLAYSAFTYALVSKYLFIAQTVPNINDLFHPLEDCIPSTTQ